MKERLKERLLELSALPGVSGHEQPIVRLLAEQMGALADSVTVDPHGNVVAVKDGGAPGPKLMVAAHSDIIGCIVRSVDENGFLRLFKVGGVIDALLVGRKVLVNEVPGIVGVRPGHIQSAAEQKVVAPLVDLYVDVGARSAEAVAELGIRIGSPVRYSSPVEELANPDLLCGAYVDNRLSCAILLETLAGLPDSFAGSFHAVVNVHEETGLRGASMTAYSVNPDVAIALDTTPGAGTPDVDFYNELPLDIGRGPVFQVASQGPYSGFAAHPKVLQWLEDSARAAGRDYQLAALPGANTDAVTIHTTRGGIPTGALTISRRYSHSPVELIDINDSVAAVEILLEAVGTLGELDLNFV